MRQLYKLGEKSLDNDTMMICGETYMIDGFIAECPYTNMSVLEFKALTFTNDVRNCDIEGRMRDYVAERERDRPILVLRARGQKVPTALEAAMRRAMDNK